MVARGLSEAKPLWRPEGGRANASPEAHGEGLQEGDGLSGGREVWREGGGDSRGKRVRGGERRERDGHRGEYRQHRRNFRP